MKKATFCTALLFLQFLCILGLKPLYSNTHIVYVQTRISSETQKNSSDTSILNHANYLLLRKYILENGKSEQVNISSMISKPIFITYHILEYNEWQLTVDHSTRIYCSLNAPSKLHVGNILVDDQKKVIIESETAENSTKIKTMLKQIMLMIR